MIFLSKALDAVIERLLIDRIVNGAGKAVTWGGKTLRLVQTGNTGFYIFAMVISIIVLLVVKSFT
jgi:NADH-quinone oxidoreductase subunit L